MKVDLQRQTKEITYFKEQCEEKEFDLIKTKKDLNYITNKSLITEQNIRYELADLRQVLSERNRTIENLSQQLSLRDKQILLGNNKLTDELTTVKNQLAEKEVHYTQ